MRSLARHLPVASPSCRRAAVLALLLAATAFRQPVVAADPPASRKIEKVQVEQVQVEQVQVEQVQVEQFKIEPGFTAIFDGRTFEGWEGNLKHFRIENGAIIAGSLKEKIPNNEFLCSKKRYGDFELRFDAKLVGQGDNAGVQFRSERIPNHHEVNGYQCDIGLMQGKPIWGWLYDESRRKKFLAEAGDPAKLAVALKKEDWNRMVVRCVGPKIQIWVNDVPTVDYVEADEGIARTGILGLQIHGGPPAEASYRNVRIKELKP